MNTPTLALPPHVRQHLYATGLQTAQALAAAVAQAARHGIDRRGAAAIALSGGRTPVRFLDELKTQPLAWSAVTVTLADDRWVAADDPDSNEGLLRRHLLLGAAADARFVPLVDVRHDPAQHTRVAERALASVPRPFDAVVLGVGQDGHTASMFPGAPGTAAAMDVQRPERVALVAPTAAPHLRITLTLRALLDSRIIMVLIEGGDKRRIVEESARSDAAQHPIAAILLQQAVPVDLYYNP